MRSRWHDNLLLVLVCTLWVGFFVYCRYRYAQKPASTDSVADHITHADTYYWFNLAGHGSNAALSSAMKQIELAEKKLDAEELPEEEKKESRKRVAGIRQDIETQQVLHKDTFHGVFTWSHFMAKPTLFQDVRATGSFELLDQPQVIASRNGINDLREDVLSSQFEIGQIDVVFVTDPADFESDADDLAERYELARQLENEALYLFNLDNRFFVHNMMEVATTLDVEEQKKLKAMQPTEEILTKLHEAWENQDILIVRLKKLDEVNNHHFWSAQGRLFRGAEAAPAAVYNNFGFCRDRRHMLGAVVFFNALMGLTAIVLFRWLSSFASHDRQPAEWTTVLGLGVIAFLWGRVAVWGLVELVEKFVPPDETLAIVSFWWPAITGFVILFGPGIMARFAEERFGWISKTFGTYNRGGVLFAATAMGSVTYVGQAALWVRTWGGWSVLPPLIIATVFAAWIIGRAFDHTEPVSRGWAIPMIIMGLLIGPVFSHSYPSWQHVWGLWFVAIGVCVVGTAALVSSGSMIRLPTKHESESEEEGRPVDNVSGLVSRTHDPPFRKTSSFNQVNELLNRESMSADHAGNDQSNKRLQIVGPAGIGKTALLRALRQEQQKFRDAIVMTGDCPEPTEGCEAESYRPFADAIADHFAVNLLLPPQNQLLGIDKAVDSIFEEVVPFSDLLFPPIHHEGASGSKKELFNSIAIMIRHLSKKHPVILIVDDAQWIDPASRELLDFLLEQFPPGDQNDVAVIVSSRERLAEFSHAETIMLEKLSVEEITTLLTEDFQFQPTSALELAEAVSEEEGNMHWLFQMISYLADKGVLTWRNGGFAWDPGTNLSDHVPDDLVDSIRAMLESHPQYRRILECASCIGPKFTVDVLSQSLNQSRLDTIQLLDDIEHNTGIVRDLEHADDSYEFRSSFILEVLRRLLDVNAHGPTEPSPQRIREYHARLAHAWEGTMASSSAALFRLATHRYAAGARHADTALSDTLNAARASSAQYQHAQARQYIDMARECASAAGLDQEKLERELLLIECNEAHVEGTNRVKVADRMLNLLEELPDSDFEIYVATALASYDAGAGTRDQKYFAHAVSIGEQIIQRFESPLEQAEGHHFVGIGLPVSNRDERRKHLEAAMELAGEAGESVEALRLKGRVANSLAEQLSYGSDVDKEQAQALFLTSIELKSRPDIRDVEGLAFAHGGLGRLAFFADEVDCDTARKHFEEDLRCSEKIGSLTGQTKMHSMLAACDLYEARQQQDTHLYGKAAQRYETAYRMAEAEFDIFFALAGVVECYEVLGDREKADEYGQALMELVQSRLKSLSDEQRKENPIAAIPRPCIDNIQLALRQCKAAQTRTWHHWLLELVENNRLLEAGS